MLATNAAVGIDAPTLADVDGHEVVLTSATAVEGGPGPDDPLATVAVRQRILSEAAVRLLSPGNEPLVVTLPTDWAPLDIRGFYTGLDVDWIDLSRVSDLTDSVVEAARARPGGGLRLPGVPAGLRARRGQLQRRRGPDRGRAARCSRS